MQQKVVPLLVPPLRKSQPGGMGSLVTKKRGMAVLTTPLLNKGSAFTVEERQSLRQLAMLSAQFFISDGEDWRLWILLGLGPVMLSLARRTQPVLAYAAP